VGTIQDENAPTALAARKGIHPKEVVRFYYEAGLLTDLADDCFLWAFVMLHIA